jgi:hypothetical protein
VCQSRHQVHRQVAESTEAPPEEVTVAAGEDSDFPVSQDLRAKHYLVSFYFPKVTLYYEA